MSTIGSNSEDLILNADGGSSTIKLKINGTEKASVSSAGAFTSTTIDATKLTGNLPAISAASLTNVPKDITVGGRKNIIINGDMQVAQRGTSSTASGFGSVDRWRSVNNVGVTHTQEAITSGDPFDAGFRHSCKLTNTAIVDNAAAHYVSFYQYIEAQDLAKSGWNYKSASSYITISFWVKSSLAGTYNVNPMTEDGTKKVYPQTFSLSANTWTKVEKSFPGHADLTFNNDTGRGMALHISPFYGTDFTDSGVSTSAWSDYGSATRFPDYAQRWGSAGTGATFEVTGVQLELGSTATDFEHRSYGEELALCQRYYEIVADASQSSDGTIHYVCGGFSYKSDQVNWNYFFQVVKRAAFTLEATTGTDYYKAILHGENIVDTAVGMTADYQGFNCVNGYISGSYSGSTNGKAWQFTLNNASAKIAVSAEL